MTMNDCDWASDWLAARATATPAAIALIESGREWTYHELDSHVQSVCEALSAGGVRAGNHVAVLLPNCLANVCLIHALARLGAVIVPLNTRLSAVEIDAQVAQANCIHIVISSSMAESHEPLPPARLILLDERLAGLEQVSPAPATKNAIVRDQLQAIIFTSGTTGTPKGAMVTFGNQYHSAISSAFRSGVLPTDRWLLSLPLYHVGGLGIVFRACLYGTAVVLTDSLDPQAVLDSIRENKVSIVSLVPTLLHRLLQSAEYSQMSALRVVLLGGAAATAELLSAARSAGIPVATTYGLTETASQVATLSPDEAAKKPGSVGHPLLFTSVRITGEDDKTLETGSVGEVCVSGPTVFAGYYGDSEATAAALRNGELHTGDLGYLDADGDLWVVQRRSDLIVSGGENVYPAEVEGVLLQHPAVEAVCVVGLPDPEWGQRVGALIVVRQPVTADELIRFTRSRLAGYKLPRVIAFTENLPMTGSGKISRPGVVSVLHPKREPTI